MLTIDWLYYYIREVLNKFMEDLTKDKSLDGSRTNVGAIYISPLSTLPLSTLQDCSASLICLLTLSVFCPSIFIMDCSGGIPFITTGIILPFGYIDAWLTKIGNVVSLLSNQITTVGNLSELQVDNIIFDGDTITSIEGSNLNNATWSDGEKCGQGSIGTCKK